MTRHDDASTAGKTRAHSAYDRGDETGAGEIVPVWTLGTVDDQTLPPLMEEDSFTPTRLSELRSALAAFSETPLVTLEAHRLPMRARLAKGLQLGASSPLAQELSSLISKTSSGSGDSGKAVSELASTGEGLFRMVVPEKFAKDFAGGQLMSMASKAAPDAIHGGLVNGKNIVGQASFVPVDTAGLAQAGKTVAGSAVRGGTAAARLASAGPFVLLALGSFLSAQEDARQREALDNITSLLGKLIAARLDDERAKLNACSAALESATAVLLDEGRIGASLGLDSAVHEIDTAVSKARDRAKKWNAALDRFPKGSASITEFLDQFPDHAAAESEFRAELELARMAIAMKQRVIVLQAVEHAQSHPENAFENFSRKLRNDQKSLTELEDEIRSFILRLSTMELRSYAGLLEKVVTKGQVDKLLDTIYGLRRLGEDLAAPADGDIVIEIARYRDGSLEVLPTEAG